MKTHPSISKILLFSSALILFGCGQSSENGAVDRTPMDEATLTELSNSITESPWSTFHQPDYYAPESMRAMGINPLLPSDPLRDQLGRIFLVEHFDVRVSPDMDLAIQNHPPGGILFWNKNQASGQELRRVILHYQQVANQNGTFLLYSTDYEGGADTLSVSGQRIPGVQRFKDGFTWLAHPSWLGVSMENYQLELCSLHGQIMARELRSVGINYPLSTSADLAYRLFRVRSISQDETAVANCIDEILRTFANINDMIFVSKHFPGMGQTTGDSHDTVARSVATTRAEVNRHLYPFQALVNTAQSLRAPNSLSFMTSHGLFPLLDDDHIATESSSIIQDLLRNQMRFQGLALSDAMWMGGYGHLGTSDLMIVYLKAFLAGHDLLMIPGYQFANAIRYFRAFYDGTLTAAQEQNILREFGKPYATVKSEFLQRLRSSTTLLERVAANYKTVDRIVDGPDVVPETTTTRLRERYREILEALR